jgi:hypothetical protein
MSLFFSPGDHLDVATDSSDLPQSADGKKVVSGSMQRCKNFRLDQEGKAIVRDGSSKLNSGAAISVPIYLIVEQSGSRYSFASTIIYKDEASIETGLTAAQWSAIKYNSFNSTTLNIFALNGTDRKRIEGSTVYEWGITAPAAAPTLAVGSFTGLTGDYNAKVTYLRKEGSVVVSESNPSAAATSAVTLADESLSVSWAASSDPQVTHVRVYRTLSDGSSYFVDQDVAIGTTTVDTNTPDASLGTEVATNHNRPPLGTYVAGPNYNGTCFILKDNLLYFCLPKQPEYWPSTYFIEVSAPQFPLKTLVFYNGQPHVLTRNKIFQIQGTGNNTFFPFEMEAVTGCEGPKCALAIKGVGIFHIGSDGVYLYASGSDINFTQKRFRPIFRGTTVNGIPGAGDLSKAWIIKFKNAIYVGYPGTADTYPTNCLRFDLDNRKTSYYTWGVEISDVTVDETNSRLLGGDENGFNWVLEDSSNTQDDSTDIAWEIESKDYTLQTRRHFPRFQKYDIDASSATTVTGFLKLDGADHQTHTITGNRQTKRRLITTGNGNRCSMGARGSGPATVYAIESE